MSRSALLKCMMLTLAVYAGNYGQSVDAGSAEMKNRAEKVPLQKLTYDGGTRQFSLTVGGVQMPVSADQVKYLEMDEMSAAAKAKEAVLLQAGKERDAALQEAKEAREGLAASASTERDLRSQLVELKRQVDEKGKEIQRLKDTEKQAQTVESPEADAASEKIEITKVAKAESKAPGLMNVTGVAVNVSPNHFTDVVVEVSALDQAGNPSAIEQTFISNLAPGKSVPFQTDLAADFGSVTTVTARVSAAFSAGGRVY